MKYLPELICFQVKAPSYYNDYYLNSTPYRDLLWKDLVAKYGIQIPEIVDMTQGKSKCKGCDAVYVGYQPKCTAKAIFHRSNAYHDQRGYHYAYPSFEKVCDGDLYWDLSDKFNLQKEFFYLLEIIGDLPDLSLDPLVKFRDSFPSGVSEVLNQRLLAFEVEKINNELPAIKNALQQIAQKMNNAGACLSFGF